MVNTNEARPLSDFSLGLSGVQNTFVEASDRKTITLLNRESTSHGSPINKSFNLNFEEIAQAVLKVNLLADKGRILEVIPNEFKLNKITVNGKVFYPSDARNSINIIEKSNDTRFSRLLSLGENELSIDFSAPIGAGVTSPNAEISAVLIINGKERFLPSVPNTTQFIKDIGTKLTDVKNQSFPILLLITFALIAFAIILLKVR